MDEPSTPAGPHARFPYGPALLCAACLGMCFWTWMRYSYAWGFTAPELRASCVGAWYRMPQVEWPVAAYVIVSGKPARGPEEHDHMLIDEAWGRDMGVVVLEPDEASFHGHVRLRGRVVEVRQFITETLPDGMRSVNVLPVVRVKASRFHPASVAGLVVAAMGAFVFGLYLRQWLRERKAAT